MKTTVHIMLLTILVVLAAGCGKRPVAKTASSGPVISLADASVYGSTVVGDKATYTYSGSWEVISPILMKSKITGETNTEIVPGMPPANPQNGVIRTLYIAEITRASRTYRRGLGSRTRRMCPKTRMDWFGQDSQNNLYFLGHMRDNTGLQLKGDNPKPLYRPSALYVSRTWDCNAWIGRTCEKWSYRVDGIEWIDTPAGRFETYKVAYSFIIDNGSFDIEETGYEWMTSATLLPVKRQFTRKSRLDKTTGMMELKTLTLAK